MRIGDGETGVYVPNSSALIASDTYTWDAEFIAAAPTDIRWLLDECSRWHEAAWIGATNESRLLERVNAVISLHATQPKANHCAECLQPYPCATIRALGVER